MSSGCASLFSGRSGLPNCILKRCAYEWVYTGLQL